MSNASITKKKEQPLPDTLFNLCKDLLRFIDRKVIKKYISPNIAQIPKELRTSELKSESDKKGWTYFYKDKEITEEEKLKDVFKDDKFLGYLENLTNSLIIVIDFLEQNQRTIKKLEEDAKNKEEKLNSLNELKNLLNNYFDKNNERIFNTENNKNILYDQNLINIMSKIQSFNSIKDDIVTKISENDININKANNSNNNINNISNISIPNDIINKSNISYNNDNSTKKEKINDIILNSQNKEKITYKKSENEKNNNQCFSTNIPKDIKIKNINVPMKNETHSKERNEIDSLIDNLQVSNFKDVKLNDKKFIEKKIQREKDTKSNEKDKLSISSKNKNLTSEKKREKITKKEIIKPQKKIIILKILIQSP